MGYPYSCAPPRKALNDRLHLALVQAAFPEMRIDRVFCDVHLEPVQRSVDPSVTCQRFLDSRTLQPPVEIPQE